MVQQEHERGKEVEEAKRMIVLFSRFSDITQRNNRCWYQNNTSTRSKERRRCDAKVRKIIVCQIRSTEWIPCSTSCLPVYSGERARKGRSREKAEHIIVCYRRQWFWHENRKQQQQHLTASEQNEDEMRK